MLIASSITCSSSLIKVQEYIDFFNRKRPHRKLKLQTPDQFEENYMAGLASNC
ncbi:MAG: IS3 family transposase [Lentisphaeria bacterium]|nr:IS3 family transposase [Lentisphaeria bacterium]